MDFHGPAGIAIRGCRVVHPHDLASIVVDLDDFARSLLHHDVAAGQHVHIMNSAPRHLPFALSVTSQDHEVVVALRNEPMLRLNRQSAECGARCHNHANDVTHTYPASEQVFKLPESMKNVTTPDLRRSETISESLEPFIFVLKQVLESHIRRIEAIVASKNASR